MLGQIFLFRSNTIEERISQHLLRTPELDTQERGSIQHVKQQFKLVPQLLAGSGELRQYYDFVVGIFAGLAIVGLMTGDVHLGWPVLGAVKGLSGAVGAAIPLVYFGELGLFLELYSVAGDTIEAVAGTGQCYPYLKLIAGAAVDVVIGGIL